MFIISFFFCKHIYNILTWPMCGWRDRMNSKIHLPPACPNISSSSSDRVSGRLLLIPGWSPAQLVHVHRARALPPTSANAFFAYLVATPIFFFLGSMVSISGVADAHAVLARHAAAPAPESQAAIELLAPPRSQDYLNLMMRLIFFRLGIAFPAAGGSYAPWPRRHPHLAAAQGESAPISPSPPS